MTQTETITIGDTAVTPGEEFIQTETDRRLTFIRAEFDDEQLRFVFTPDQTEGNQVRLSPLEFLHQLRTGKLGRNS